MIKNLLGLLVCIFVVVGFLAVGLSADLAPSSDYIEENLSPENNPNLAKKEFWNFSDSFTNSYGSAYRLTDRVPEGRYKLSFFVSRETNLNEDIINNGYPYCSAGRWIYNYYSNLTGNLRPNSLGFVSFIFDFTYFSPSPYPYYIYFVPCSYVTKFDASYTVSDLRLIRLGDIPESKSIQSFEYIPTKEDIEFYDKKFQFEDKKSDLDASASAEQVPEEQKSYLDALASAEQVPEEEEKKEGE